jgi:hypothetical protein
MEAYEFRKSQNIDDDLRELAAHESTGIFITSDEGGRVSALRLSSVHAPRATRDTHMAIGVVLIFEMTRKRTLPKVTSLTHARRTVASARFTLYALSALAV